MAWSIKRSSTHSPRSLNVLKGLHSYISAPPPRFASQKGKALAFFLRRASVVAQFDCHPEQVLFAQRGIWASRAMRRALRDATIAPLARFRIKVSRYPRLSSLNFQLIFLF